MGDDLPPGVGEWCERIEALAWADVVRAMGEDPANPLDARVGEAGGVPLPLLGRVPMAIFNRVVGLGVERPATEPDVDAVVSFYAAAGQDAYAVSLWPLAQPAALASWLEARGIARSRNWAKVWRTAERPPEVPTPFRIERISERERSAFAEINMAAFGVPATLEPWFGSTVGRHGWQHYLGYEGDRPVTAGALYVVGDVGWLGFGATLPSHRNQGGQGAIFARRIRDAAELGCRLLVTETGEDTPEQPNPSYRNMIRSGFQLAYLRPNFVHRAPG